VIQALRARELWPASEGRPARMRREKITDTYDYCDETGTLLFQVVRIEPKAFKQRRPDGRDGWTWQLGNVRRVLYRLPEILAAPADATVYVVEGEKDANRLASLGLIATTNPGGAGKWRSEYSHTLRGRAIIILPDNDEPGRAHAQQVAHALHRVAASVKVLELPGLPDHGDVSDWLDADGTREALEALAAQTPLWSPLTLATALDATVVFIRRYTVQTLEEVIAEALWVMHTWFFQAAETTPYLHIQSPEKRSGKTRLLEVLSHLVRQPWLTGRVTAAVLVRKIDAECPTLLLDETDAAFGSSEEYAEALRGVLNSGHRKGGKTSVCVGQGAQLTYRDFSVFCPKAFAGLKRLPETVEDRAIPIRLRRRTRTETIERYRYRDAEEAARPLREQFAASAPEAIRRLQGAQPEIPEELDDRAAEGWEPLLAIADLAGGDWPERARRAALALSAGQAREDESLGVRLLADIRRIFDQRGEDRITSADLVEVLNADREAPWSTYRKTGLTQYVLAGLLKSFQVRPATIWLPRGRTAKGYKREDFEDAWTRYLPSDPSGPSGLNTDAGFRTFSDPSGTPLLTDRKIAQKPLQERVLTDLTDLAPDRASADVSEPGPQASPPLPEASQVKAGPPGDDGRRAVLLRMGQTLEWPEFAYKPGVSIMAGEGNWRKFAMTHGDAEVEIALRALEKIG